VNPVSRRPDIPAAVQWLQHSDAPATDEVRRAMAQRTAAREDDVPPAGGAHPNLGTLAIAGRTQGLAGMGDRYWAHLTAGFSEEEKRQYLATGGRRRRFSDIKHQATDTLGLGKPLPLSGFKGGPVPTGPHYKSAPANPWPKLAVEPREPTSGAPELGDPRLAAYPPASRSGRAMAHGSSRLGSPPGGGFMGSQEGSLWEHPASWASEEPSYLPLSDSGGGLSPGSKRTPMGSTGAPPGSASPFNKALPTSSRSRAQSSNKPQSVGGQGPEDFSPWVATRWGNRADPEVKPSSAKASAGPQEQQQELMLQGEPAHVGQQSRSRGQVSFEDSGSIAGNGAFQGEAFPQF